LPEDEKDEHNKLYGYIVLLVIGLIVLISGLQSLPSGWIAILIGGGLSAFAGFEVKFTYNKIQNEEGSIRARQSGTGNVQTNVSNPTNSPVIHRADNVIINPSPRKSRNKPESTRQRIPELKSEDDIEWLCDGDIHFNRYQEFEAPVKKGDKIVWHLESKEPISLQVLSRKDYDILADLLDGEIGEDEGEYHAYTSTPLTTKHDLTWTVPVNRTLIVVITGGTKEDDDDDFNVKVNARIGIIRKKE